MQEHSVFDLALTHYLSLLTILGGIFVIIFAVTTIYLWSNKTLYKYGQCLGNYIFPIGFFTTLAGMFLTLLYSEVFHYVPCDLCWYQRVFLYPQVFIFAYAWYKKDRVILPYTLLLSVLGLVVAVYHHILQLGYNIYKPCSTAPFAVDCAKPSFIEYGFVTFPFMAVVLFGFLSTFLITSLHNKTK